MTNPLLKSLVRTAGMAITRAVAVEGIGVVSEQVGNRFGHDHASVRLLNNAHLFISGQTHGAMLQHYSGEQCAAHADAEYVAGNYGSARQWAQMGIERGHAYCMVVMGIIYQNGNGVEADLGEATHHYFAAFNAGEENYSLKFLNQIGITLANCSEPAVATQIF